MANGWGGARPGAGRKPKRALYAEAAEVVEGKIIDALPQIIDTLIVEATRKCNTAAARYLVDRVLGRGSLADAVDTQDEVDRPVATQGQGAVGSDVKKAIRRSVSVGPAPAGAPRRRRKAKSRRPELDTA